MNTISFPKIFNNNVNKLSSNLSYDIKSTNESLKSLLSTSPGELLGDPAYGCGLKNKLFDVANTLNMTELRMIIENAISKYLPYIYVNSSTIKIYSNPDKTKYKIVIPYQIRSLDNVSYFEMVI